MKTIIGLCAVALSLCALTQAATVTTTLTVTSTVTVGGTAITSAGTATLSNGVGSGTFSANLPLSNVSSDGKNVSGTFSITLSNGTLTGTITLPISLLNSTGTSGSGSGSAQVASGTGSFAGASSPSFIITGGGQLVGTAITVNVTSASFVLTTTGGTSTPPANTPTITAVLDAGGYTPSIAEGSVFVVKGTNLSAAGVTSFGFPLAATQNGVQINFTPVAGGSPTGAYLIYLYNQGGVNQLAAVLPSTLAAGNYNVTVTSNSQTSAPFAATVVQRKPGLLTQDTTGSGIAVVQNYISATQVDINKFTTGSVNGFTISPAKPGQTLTAWATGLGPVTGGDNTASPGFNFVANGVTIQAVVGGVNIVPAYAGRAPGFAGADQINFTLPANVPTGCTVPFQLSVNGVLSNATFISIAPGSSASVCSAAGFTTSQLQNLDNGGALNFGEFDLFQFASKLSIPTVGTVSAKIDSLGGGFTRITGYQLAAASNVAAAAQPAGACQVVSSTSAQSGTGTTTVTTSSLDAGTITFNGPAGSNLTNQTLTNSNNAYSLNIGYEISGITLPPGFTFPGIPNANLVAGNYTLKGAGGKDVGAFNASINLGTPLTITGDLPATVNRSAGLTLNWTGGNASDLVEITGSNAITTNNVVSSTSFICTTTAGARTFTVPASILQQLPATPSGATAVASSLLTVVSGPFTTNTTGNFTAPLTAGGSIDYGAFLALVGVSGTVTYQ